MDMLTRWLKDRNKPAAPARKIQKPHFELRDLESRNTTGTMLGYAGIWATMALISEATPLPEPVQTYSTLSQERPLFRSRQPFRTNSKATMPAITI